MLTKWLFPLLIGSLGFGLIACGGSDSSRLGSDTSSDDLNAGVEPNVASLTSHDSVPLVREEIVLDGGRLGTAWGEDLPTLLSIHTVAAIVQVTGYEDISFSAGEYVAPENHHEEALLPDEVREIQASPAYIPSLTRFEVKFEHVIWGETPKEPTAYVLQAGGYAHEKAYSHYGSLLEVGKTYLVMLEEMALNPGSYYDSPMGIYEIVEGRLEALVPAGTAAAVEMLDGTRLSDAVSLVQQAGEAVAPKDPFNEGQP